MMTPPEHDLREAVLNARFQAWSVLAAAFVTIVGTVVLVGWSLGTFALIRISSRLPAMNPLTAFSFVLSGFSLALLRESRLTSGRRKAAQLIGLLVAGIGLMKVVGLVTGSGPKIDHIMFTDAIETLTPGGRGGMAPNTAINFILFGMALVYFAGVSKLSHRLSQSCSAVGTVIAMLPLLGYLYGADMLRGFGLMIPMALHTATCFVVLGTGLLIAPGTQAIKLVSRADQGGRIVRRFFPAIVGTIVVLGYLRLAGQRAGWYGTEMGAALMVAGTIVALAGLLWWNAGVISAADRRRLDVEAALHLSESALRAANEALALQVRTDSLTMVRNRMALDEELLRAIQNLHRYEAEIFSVLMVDVDYFKRYNDTFGHLAGDDTLREAARLLETTCRTTDIVGRYGGEEFTIILPHTTEQGSREIAERLRASVERHPWPHAPITVSVGVATASPATVGADEILNEADVALYLAKQNGRNRVYHALDTALAAEA